ncbi:MAG: 50S ribosomal protein L31 [Chloroflexi bacterium]|nr:50S ribosomal protein L31 [Chloroflexota bacterium]
MKPGIHPSWYPDALVTCACGNTWTTGSTKKEIHTDVCNKCHPFFTGEQRIVDTAGQVERFMKRINAKEQIAAAQPSVEEKKAKKDKRREHKGTTTVSLKPTVEAPAELPLAVVSETPAATEAPTVEQPAPKAQAPKAVEPVAKAEEPAPAARVEEAAPAAELGEEQAPAPAAAVEEPAPVASIEETAPVAQVEEATRVAVVEETTPVVAPAEEPTQISPNDLTIIEGVGPKIASVLQDAGIATLEQVSNTSADKLSEVLKAAGINLADPATWSQQAKFAAEGKIEELHKLQDELTGGRRTKKTTPRKPRAPRAKKENTEEK